MKRQRKSMLRRILTVLLSLAMVLNSSGITVSAQGGTPSYYIVGPMNEYTFEEAYKMSPTEMEGVYCLYGVELNNGDYFKVESSLDEWFPNGMDDDYQITSDGTYDIYFRPDYGGDDDWYLSCLYVTESTGGGSGSSVDPEEPTDPLPEGNAWGPGNYLVAEDLTINGNVTINYDSNQNDAAFNTVAITIAEGKTLTISGNIENSDDLQSRFIILGNGTFVCNGDISVKSSIIIGSGNDDVELTVGGSIMSIYSDITVKSGSVSVDGDMGSYNDMVFQGGNIEVKGKLRSDDGQIVLAGGTCKAGSYHHDDDSYVTVTIQSDLIYLDHDTKEGFLGCPSEERLDVMAGKTLEPALFTTVTNWAELRTALNDDGVIVLDDDIEADPSDEMLVVPEGANVVLYLGDHAIGGYDLDSEYDAVLTVNGSLVLTAENTGSKGMISGWENPCVVKVNGNLTLIGGEIVGTALEETCVDDENSFTMIGGYVYGALDDGKSAGVHVAKDADFMISGAPVINNVYLEDGAIKLMGALENPCLIPVAVSELHEGCFTDGWKANMKDANPAYYFESAGYEHVVCRNNAGEAVLVATMKMDDPLVMGENPLCTELPYTFTPERSGFYSIYAVGPNETRCNLNAEEGNILVEECPPYDPEDRNFRVEAYLYADHAYDLEVSSDSGKAVSVFIEAIEPAELELGENMLKAYGKSLYAFTPQEDGKYIFHSQVEEDSDLDLEGFLFGEDGLLASDDDGGWEYNFCFSTILTAGQTYVFQVRYACGDGDEDFSVFVEKGTMTEWDELQSAFQAGGEEPFKLTKNYRAVSGDSKLYVPEGKKVILDLNGHTIDGSAINNEQEDILVVFGELDVTDGAKSGGAIVGGGGDTVIFVEGGYLRLDKGTVTGGDGEDASIPVCVESGVIGLVGAPGLSRISLGSEGIIQIEGELTYQTPITITAETSGDITSGWGCNMEGKNPADYFVSADRSYRIHENMGELEGVYGLKYLDKDGKEKTCKEYRIISDRTELCDQGGWYAITDEFNLEHLEFLKQDQEAVHLILCDYAALYISDYFTSDRDLYIYGQENGTGELRLGDEDNPGINSFLCHGDLGIYGGKLYVCAGEGIVVEGTQTVIQGGDVCAEGQYGLWATKGTIAITGGQVDLTATLQHALQADEAISITGGAVRARNVGDAQDRGAVFLVSEDKNNIPTLTLGWSDPNWGTDTIILEGVSSAYGNAKVILTNDFVIRGYEQGVYSAGEYSESDFNTEMAYSDLEPSGVTHDIDLVVNNETMGGLSASRSKASEGQTVTLTVWPNSWQYRLTSLTFMQEDAEEPVVIENNQFLMPGGDVTVTATFAERQECTVAAYAYAFVGDDEVSVGNVSIEGESSYLEDDHVSLKAPDKSEEGYRFIGWFAHDKAKAHESADLLCDTLLYDFIIEENIDVVALYEVRGNANVKIISTNSARYTVGDDPEVQQGSNMNVRLGTMLTIYAKDTNQVLNWKNASGKILGTGDSLTIAVTGDMTIELVYKSVEEGQAYLQYVSREGQVLLSRRVSSATTSITEPAIPSKFGYTFDKWVIDGTNEEATLDNIKARISPTDPVITVKPSYVKNEVPGSVTVSYKNAVGVDISEQVVYDKNIVVGDSYAVTAPEYIGDYQFECWKSGDTVLGYDRSYFMKITGDVTLTACYVDEDEEVECRPVIVAGQPFTTVAGTGANAVHKITCIITRDVSDGYTLLEQGVLYARGDGLFDKESLVLGSTNADVTKYQSPDQSRKGTLTANIKTVGDNWEDIVVYFRGYMILRDNATGNDAVFYSDVVYASYNSLQQ